MSPVAWRKPVSLGGAFAAIDGMTHNHDSVAGHFAHDRVRPIGRRVVNNNDLCSRGRDGFDLFHDRPDGATLVKTRNDDRDRHFDSSNIEHEECHGIVGTSKVLKMLNPSQ